MSVYAHESREYQDFLISEQRRGLIPPELYDAFVPSPHATPVTGNVAGPSVPVPTDLVIMDFGSGLGYVSAHYSQRFGDMERFHVYACDYQVELLDSLWRRIVENKFRNITPFFMPRRSRLNFPLWVPRPDHVVMSFSMSTAENPLDLLITLKAFLKKTTLLHIVEWDAHKSHPLIDPFISSRYRLDEKKVMYYLEKAGYAVKKPYKTGGPYFALTVSPVFAEENGKSSEQAKA